MALWGVTFISTKVLINAGLEPAQIFAIRFTVAYLGIWLLCLRGTRALRLRGLWAGSVRDELIFVLLGITGGSMYFLAENTALACTQACNVSFIVCSAPLITALLTIFARRVFRGDLAEGLEDVGGRWQLFAGTALALCGIAAVTFDGAALQFSAKGDLLALAAALCWGFYSILMGQMTVRYGTLFATRKVFFWGLVTIIPWLGGSWPPLQTFARPEVWGNLLFLSLAASLACFVLWNKVLSRIGNVTATNYVYLNPLFTLVAATVFLGETLTLQSALGCAAILGGVIIGGLKGRGMKNSIRIRGNVRA